MSYTPERTIRDLRHAQSQRLHRPKLEPRNATFPTVPNDYTVPMFTENKFDGMMEFSAVDPAACDVDGEHGNDSQSLSRQWMK
jgi:hypothetical protein